MWQKCPICNGVGTIPSDNTTVATIICSTCQGTKIISEVNSLPPNWEVSISDKQLSELISKVSDRIKNVLNKEGKSTKSIDLSKSVSDIISNYVKKHCN